MERLYDAIASTLSLSSSTTGLHELQAAISVRSRNNDPLVRNAILCESNIAELFTSTFQLCTDHEERDRQDTLVKIVQHVCAGNSNHDMDVKGCDVFAPSTMLSVLSRQLWHGVITGDNVDTRMITLMHIISQSSLVPLAVKTAALEYLMSFMQYFCSKAEQSAHPNPSFFHIMCSVFGVVSQVCSKGVPVPFASVATCVPHFYVVLGHIRQFSNSVVRGSAYTMLINVLRTCAADFDASQYVQSISHEFILS